ncbi:MAG: hypothetical protein ACI4SS_05710 [Clostridia bacterium]
MEKFMIKKRDPRGGHLLRFAEKYYEYCSKKYDIQRVEEILNHKEQHNKRYDSMLSPRRELYEIYSDNLKYYLTDSYEYKKLKKNLKACMKRLGVDVSWFKNNHLHSFYLDDMNFFVHLIYEYSENNKLSCIEYNDFELFTLIPATEQLFEIMKNYLTGDDYDTAVAKIKKATEYERSKKLYLLNNSLKKLSQLINNFNNGRYIFLTEEDKENTIDYISKSIDVISDNIDTFNEIRLNQLKKAFEEYITPFKESIDMFLKYEDSKKAYGILSGYSLNPRNLFPKKKISNTVEELKKDCQLKQQQFDELINEFKLDRAAMSSTYNCICYFGYMGDPELTAEEYVEYISNKFKSTRFMENKLIHNEYEDIGKLIQLCFDEDIKDLDVLIAQQYHFADLLESFGELYQPTDSLQDLLKSINN